MDPTAHINPQQNVMELIYVTHEVDSKAKAHSHEVKLVLYDSEPCCVQSTL